MNIKILFIIFGVLSFNSVIAQVSINTDGSDPDSSAILDLKSTNKGFLPPRLNTDQINNISKPAEGLIVYDTDKNEYYYFDGAYWTNMCSGANSPPKIGSFYGGGNIFTNSIYWSSTEYDNTSAWAQSFNIDWQVPIGKNYDSVRVRAIRRF